MENHTKRILVWTMIVLTVAGLAATGRRVDSSEAQRVAMTFLDGQQRPSVDSMSASSQDGDLRPLYDTNHEVVVGYVMELEPRGYVVVSIDTELEPVIAYSRDSDFDWEQGPSNVLLDILRTDLTLRLQALTEGAISSTRRAENERAWSPSSIAPSSGRMIGPLIESSTWAQGEPWSALLPIDPSTGNRSMTGCGATALAQIVNYWDYPTSITFSGSDSYVTQTRYISVDATEADIPQISYPAKSHHNPTDHTMAQLSFAAGVSIKMDYTSNGSGALAMDIAVALAGGRAPAADSKRAHPGIWGYESADIRTFVNTFWGDPYVQSATAFFDALQTDMEEGRPAILMIKTQGSSIGHILICDGYDPESGRYHLNLGWGGHSDGWYALPEDLPAGYNWWNTGS